MAANTNVRYVRWTTASASGTGSGMVLCGIQVYAGGVNVAAGALSTVSVAATWNVYPSGVFPSGTVNQTSVSAGGTTLALTTVPNGSTINDASYLSCGSDSPVVIVVDLGAPYTIQSIEIWPWFGTYFGPAWTFSGVEIDLSPTGLTNSWTTVFGPATVSAAGLTGTQGYVTNTFCFLRGTRIATPHGYREIQDIQEGDDVFTADGRVVAVVEHRKLAWDVDDAPAYRPIRIPRGVLGAQRDLLVSERHGILTERGLAPAVSVEGAEAATDIAGVVHYHHLRLPQPTDLLVAEGVVCESLRLANA
jgi:hypothetical protein